MEEAVEVVRWRPWSDVHEDMLRLIFAKLYFADQTRFRAVCKGWRSPVYGGRSKEKLPWLLNIRVSPRPPRISEYNLFTEKKLCDLYNQKTYFIQEHNLDYKHNATVLASRYGWLLLGDENWIKRETRFIVYNPFTRQVINLPILDQRYGADYNATFSSAPPTSPECLFFVCCYIWDGSFDIRMFQYGNETWTTKYLCCKRHFLGRAESMVYINGVLYLTFQWGYSGVFAFDVENKQGQWYLPENHNSIFSHSKYLVEANGELLWATRSYDHKWNIFKLDSSDNKTSWIPQITLENQALFVGCISLLVPAVGDASFLANKIYYHDGKSRVYCLLSGKSRKKDKIYNCIRTRYWSRIWIEPPL